MFNVHIATCSMFMLFSFKEKELAAAEHIIYFYDSDEVVEDLLAAAVEMVHMPTPLDSQVWHHSSKLTLLFRQQYM